MLYVYLILFLMPSKVKSNHSNVINQMTGYGSALCAVDARIHVLIVDTQASQIIDIMHTNPILTRFLLNVIINSHQCDDYLCF